MNIGKWLKWSTYVYVIASVLMALTVFALPTGGLEMTGLQMLGGFAAALLFSGIFFLNFYLSAVVIIAVIWLLLRAASAEDRGNRDGDDRNRQ